jgi:hypothetical protein
MASTPSPSLPPYRVHSLERIRLTISVSPETHATFQRLAAAGSMSISRAMGDWLADTGDAAEFMAETMEKARAAPKIVMRELHSYALGLVDETGSVLQRMRATGPTAGGARSAPRPAGRSASPPPSNTGGKGSPGKGGKSGART